MDQPNHKSKATHKFSQTPELWPHFPFSAMVEDREDVKMIGKSAMILISIIIPLHFTEHVTEHIGHACLLWGLTSQILTSLPITKIGSIFGAHQQVCAWGCHLGHCLPPHSTESPFHSMCIFSGPKKQ